jgi:uncharacterized membrane protein YebE (DUF533 family)
MIKHLKNFLLKQAEEISSKDAKKLLEEGDLILELKKKPSLTSRAFKTMGLITLGGLGSYGAYKLWKAKHQNSDQNENSIENPETLKGF